ncbi:hypothetical protein ELR70_18930 [Pseudoalteromonas sp. R3]|nr:hypothetical protein ELR70_18930 [Pseudoalteromonas sp. R3]
MSVDFAQIEATLNELDVACQAGELEEAQRLFKQADAQIRATLTREILAESELCQRSAANIYHHIQELTTQLHLNRTSVAKELSQFVGNQKKIKAYKNT